MSPDFSEFSYGYAVTEELVSHLKASLIAAPLFPSLYEEGKAGGGYDVNIPLSGKPVFLQFKLSHYLERENAKEHRDGILTTPYYRMHLRPTKHSDQHNLLLDLEASEETVFYIAPEFHLPSELNDFYLRKTVVENSAAFSPSDIGPMPDDHEHYIVFKRGSATAHRCSSSPIELKKTSLKNGLTSLLNSRQIESREIGNKGLHDLSHRMIATISRAAPRRENQNRKPVDIESLARILSSRPNIESAGYIARTFFDAELLIIP